MILLPHSDDACDGGMCPAHTFPALDISDVRVKMLVLKWTNAAMESKLYVKQERIEPKTISL